MLWLSDRMDRFEELAINRFDPRFWTVNFPRPMMGAITNPGGEAMTITLTFYRKNDIAGLIWESEDRFDHPLLSYETRKDYRGVVLTFRWKSTGIRTLPELFGPTMTIEGRDAAGNPRTWFVRLWNYSEGTSADAVITLDFDALDGGFLLPSERDPVYPGDIDRLFISMVPSEFDNTATTALTGGPVTGEVQISDIRVTGGGADLSIGADYIKPHRLRMANGYDDSLNITPARLVRAVTRLGYREWLTHYVGMSHFYTMHYDDGEGRFVVDPAAPAINSATRAWHRDFFARLKQLRITLVLSLSFELLAQDAPWEWAQRDHAGNQALTGWSPPSTVLSPTNNAAMGWLERVLDAFGDLMVEAGLSPVFQLGEPWWWVSLAGARPPHFYDSATMQAYRAETGRSVPAKHVSAEETPNADQVHYLDWLGAKLGSATHRLRDHVKARYPGAQVTLLFFTPQVLDDRAPMLRRTNFPVSHWAYPAFDFMQVEDYDHVIAGDWLAHQRGLDTVINELGYPMETTHYFGGFVLNPKASVIWKNMERALIDTRKRGFGERAIWAYTQLIRDGVVAFEAEEETDMVGFHDVRLPQAVSFGSTGGPRFSTRVMVTASGHEKRNRNWDQARAEYDLSTGIRSAADLAMLAAFFRARAGRAYGFRFQDWADHRSSEPMHDPGPLDQHIGLGDGVSMRFQLVKIYGDGETAHIRTITRPVEGSVRIAVDGVEMVGGWQCDISTGSVTFSEPPIAGAVITAGYYFDVPVRFIDDSLPLSLDGFNAGSAPAIRLLEIRE